MSFNLIRCPPKPLLLIIALPLPFLDLLALFLKFRKLRCHLISFIKQLSQLREKHNIGQVETTVLMIVAKVCIGIISTHSERIFICQLFQKIETIKMDFKIKAEKKYSLKIIQLSEGKH